MWYLYYGKNNRVNLEELSLIVLNSNISNKTLLGFRWDEAPATLKVVFDNNLSSSDKTILDDIISQNT